MSRALSLLLIVILAINVALPVWGKKHPTTTTAPATQEAPKEKGKEKGGDVETHKHLASEFENGKELDAEKTKGKVGTLSDQVNALDKKLKDSGKGTADAEEPSAKHKHHAASQPATQETPKSEKTKSKR
jgi:hypothetical protein